MALPAGASATPFIGIDVVDLAHPRTRDRHLDERFLGRVFADFERDIILGSDDPALEIWRLWAMKEAAFKAIGSRVHPEPPPVFTHREFEVDRDSEAEDPRVVWRDLSVRVCVQRSGPGWWVAVAGLGADGSEIEPGPPPFHSVESIESVAERFGLGPGADPVELLTDREAASVHSRPSCLVRLAARRSLSAVCGVDESRLAVVAGDEPRGRTPPVVLLDGSEALDPPLRVTLSHDGPWIAWAVAGGVSSADGS